MKTSRRDFLKLAGKATVAAATAGAAVKAGAEPVANEADVSRPVYVSSVVDDVQPSTVVTNDTIRTSELALLHFSKSMEADITLNEDLTGGRIRNPFTRNISFQIEAYLEAGQVWGVYNGSPMTLIVDHVDAPEDTRGEYNVVVTDVDMVAVSAQPAIVTLLMKEVL